MATAPFPDPAETAATTGRVRVWDLPTRLFHWLLVALVAVNLYTGLVGGLAEMDLHIKSGYAILALVLFRIVWGFAGSRRSRFTDFVRGPLSVLAYARSLIGKAHRASVGHNPLGGWSVLAILASLTVQAATGLFSNDDIFTEGPLAAKVTKATSDALTTIHHLNGDLLMILIAIHLSAVAYYRIAKGQNLVRPMLTGHKRTGDVPAEADEPYVPTWRGAVVLAAAAAAVWLIVTF